MHQRQVEGEGLVVRDFLVPALRNGPGGYVQSFWVGAESFRGAPIDVARKLVEQNKEGECAFRLRSPVIELIGSRLLYKGAKLLFTDLIEAFRRNLDAVRIGRPVLGRSG